MSLFKNKKELVPSWSLVEPSVQLIRDNFLTLCFLSFFATAALTYASLNLNESGLPGTTLATAMGVFGFVWFLVFIPAQIYAELAMVRGYRPSFAAAAKSGMPYFWKTIGLLLLLVLITIAGLILFIVPGLIFMKKFALSPYYLIDKNVSIKEAMQLSNKAAAKVPGYIWGILGVSFVFAVLSSAAIYAPFLGLVLSLVLSYVYMFAFALRYAEIEFNIKPQLFVKD